MSRPGALARQGSEVAEDFRAALKFIGSETIGAFEDVGAMLQGADAYLFGRGSGEFGREFDASQRRFRSRMPGAYGRYREHAQSVADERLSPAVQFGLGMLAPDPFGPAGDVARGAGALAAAPALMRVTKAHEAAPKFRRGAPIPEREVRRGPNVREEANIQSWMPDLRARVPEAMRQMQEGEAIGKRWYNLQPLYRQLREIGFNHRDALQQLEGFAARTGATSSASDVPSNIRRALWSTAAANQGAPISRLHPRMSGGAFGPQGHPYYFNAMQPGLESIESAVARGQSGLAGIADNRKWHPYAGALAGSYNRNPVDLHEMRFWFGDQSKVGPEMLPKSMESPKESQRAALGRIYDDLARETGLPKAQLMAMRWVGGADMTHVEDPRAFVTILDEQIAGLAERMDTTPKEALRRVFTGEVELPFGEVDNWTELGGEFRTTGLSKIMAAQTEAISKMDPGRAAFVSPLNPDDFDFKKGKYKGSLFLMSDDGMTGAFMSPDGYIGGLYSAPGTPKGQGLRVLDQMIAAAGGPENVRLDHFDGGLSPLYESRGLPVTQRFEWDDAQAPPNWDYERYERPDYILRGEHPE